MKINNLQTNLMTNGLLEICKHIFDKSIDDNYYNWFSQHYDIVVNSIKECYNNNYVYFYSKIYTDNNVFKIYHLKKIENVSIIDGYLSLDLIIYRIDYPNTIIECYHNENLIANTKVMFSLLNHIVDIKNSLIKLQKNNNTNVLPAKVHYF